MIQHRTKRAIYVVLLCVALFASAFSIFNQFAKDNNAAQLAGQVSQICAENRSLAIAQGLDCDKANDVKENTPAVIEGPKGDPGERGVPGLQGDSGLSGRDGIAGAQGQPGDNGSQGAVGATGDMGSTGSTGPPGSVGPEGPQGPKGDTGAQGDRGADGEPGASAPEITAFNFQGGITDCQLVVTTSDEATYRVAVPGAFCVSQ
jgi:hypothetical protein